MSEITRYELWELMVMKDAGGKDWVSYTDHLSALEAVKAEMAQQEVMWSHRLNDCARDMSKAAYDEIEAVKATDEDVSLVHKVGLLLDALKPFSREADSYDATGNSDEEPASDNYRPMWGMEGSYMASASYTVKDLRRARSIVQNLSALVPSPPAGAPSSNVSGVAPVGYVTRMELDSLRRGYSCVDLFGEVIPKGPEMVPLYASFDLTTAEANASEQATFEIAARLLRERDADRAALEANQQVIETLRAALEAFVKAESDIDVSDVIEYDQQLEAAYQLALAALSPTQPERGQSNDA